MRIRNWQEYQHYKKRNPPWIKLHNTLLNSRDWVALSDASRVLAVACMLIAARNGTDGEIPDDLEYIKRVAYLNELPDFKPLINCGFIECASTMQSDASNVLASACSETEKRSEKSTETEQTPAPSSDDAGAKPDPPPKKKKTKPKEDTTPQHKAMKFYESEYLRVVGMAPSIQWAADTNHMKSLLSGRTLDELMLIITEFLEHPPAFFADKGLSIGHMLKAAPKVIQQLAKKKKPNQGLPPGATYRDDEGIARDPFGDPVYPRRT